METRMTRIRRIFADFYLLRIFILSKIKKSAKIRPICVIRVSIVSAPCLSSQKIKKSQRIQVKGLPILKNESYFAFH
ncbi:MAG: hypothetical protein RL329_2683 [Bacteroidota bacterium]|jgi:hypothetical protein